MCKSVHDERPNASTSGGQSEGEFVEGVVSLAGARVLGAKVEVFIMLFQAAPDVHVRHLHHLS